MVNRETLTRGESGQEQLAVKQIATLDKLSFSCSSVRRGLQEPNIPPDYEKKILTQAEIDFLRTASPEEFMKSMLEGYDPQTDDLPRNYKDNEAFYIEQEIEEAAEIEYVRTGKESAISL